MTQNVFVYDNKPYVLQEIDTWVVNALAPYCKIKNKEFIKLSKKIFGNRYLIKDNLTISIFIQNIMAKYHIPTYFVSKVKLSHCRTIRDISLYIYDLQNRYKEEIERIDKFYR